MRKIGYIGCSVELAEYIFFDEELQLDIVICEKERFSDDMLTFCLIRNVQYILVENKKDFVEKISCIGHEVDFFIMYSFGIIIPSEIIQKIKIFNIHPSLLPKYKGRNPVYWAMIQNEKFIGITLHEVVEGIDEGKIITQYKVPNYIWKNIEQINVSLNSQMPKILNDLVRYLNNERDSCDNHKGEYWPRISNDDITIDINTDSYDIIFNKVRTQFNYKGAKLQYEGNTYWIKKMTFSNTTSNYDENVIYIPYKDNIYIKLLEFYIEDDKKI